MLEQKRKRNIDEIKYILIKKICKQETKNDLLLVLENSVCFVEKNYEED